MILAFPTFKVILKHSYPLRLLQCHKKLVHESVRELLHWLSSLNIPNVHISSIQALTLTLKSLRWRNRPREHRAANNHAIRLENMNMRKKVRL